jgi:hypothetical protein
LEVSAMTRRLSIRLAAVLALLGCGGGRPAPSSGTVDAPPAARLRATPLVAAPCGPDWLERHALSVSDLDGDGTLDRPSLLRVGDTLEVRLHALPSLRATRTWRIPAGYVELATPRRRGSRAGDLWLSVGRGDDKPWDGSTAPASTGWTETLYHLEAGVLVPLISGYRDIDLRVDVDGDGVVDPIGSAGGGPRVLLGGGWVDLPVLLSDWVHGAPLQHGQEEATDLDGNGVRELVLQTDAGVSIVEVPGFRTIWSVAGEPWKPALVPWGESLVLAVRLDGTLRVFATDATHAELAAYPDAESFAEIHPWRDPVTGAAQLLVTGYPAHVYDRARPTTPAATVPRVAARMGVSPPTLEALPFDVRKDDVPFVLAHEVGLVDLDADGAIELVVEERSSMESSERAIDTLRLRVLATNGEVRWEEPWSRTQEWAGPDLREVERDDTHVRAFDLGDGTLPLRVRSAVDEYYLLSPRSTLTEIPPCLE